MATKTVKIKFSGEMVVETQYLETFGDDGVQKTLKAWILGNDDVGTDGSALRLADLGDSFNNAESIEFEGEIVETHINKLVYPIPVEYKNNPNFFLSKLDIQADMLQ
jgi:hypothetical protein